MTRKRPDSRIEFYSNFALRKFVWNVGSRFRNYYFVAEYPKSGGTWFSQMLADYMEIPFARNISRPYLRESVIHGHEKPKKHLEHSFLVIRDGRDVMVSFYYHHFFKNEWNFHKAVDKRREKMAFKDYNDIETNLPAFIEYIANEWARGFNHIHWGEFNKTWIGHTVPGRVVRYEDLKNDCYTAMEDVLNTLEDLKVDKDKLTSVIEKNAFNKVAGRAPGQENNSSFARKGIVGDWKNVYTEKSCIVFDKYFGDSLIEFGYESDKSWIEQAG